MSELTKKHKSFIDEFMGFVKGFGVIGLAIGVIIGGAAKTIVDSLVENIINPLLAMVGGLDNISELWVVNGVKIGAFVGDFINFLIMLFIVYVVVKLVISNFLSEKEKEEMGM